MSKAIQLDFFEDIVDFQAEEIKLINMKVDNIRRGLFKRHGELSKMYVDVWDRQEKLDTRIFAMEKFLTQRFGYISFDGRLDL